MKNPIEFGTNNMITWQPIEIYISVQVRPPKLKKLKLNKANAKSEYNQQQQNTHKK